MTALSNLLIFVALITFFLGVVIVIYPIASLGFDRRRDGVLVMIAAIALSVLGTMLDPEPRTKSTSHAAATVAPTPDVEKPVSKADALKAIRIDGFRWEKDGFGSVMKATFTLYNDNRFGIKDVVVTCTHAANSGTIIDSNTRTVYERISARDYLAVNEMNMGFIHSKVSSSSCRVTNFARS